MRVERFHRVYEAGSHSLTREQIGTRYVATGIRMLVDPSDPKDIERVPTALLSESTTSLFARTP